VNAIHCHLRQSPQRPWMTAIELPRERAMGRSRQKIEKKTLNLLNSGINSRRDFYERECHAIGAVISSRWVSYMDKVSNRNIRDDRLELFNENRLG
jgi:recombinational DNA repair ATPase RecF